MADTDQSDPSARPPRYRCTSCGNLTRFDVTSSRRTTAFHHYSVGGELNVEDVDVLDEVIESVVCRWCTTADGVVELAGDASSDPTTPHDATVGTVAGRTRDEG